MALEPLGCPFAEDSIFADSGAVVVGTVASGHATLQRVSGTTGATGYSLAENGASIVFTLRDDLRLFKVPRLGGTASPVAPVTTATGNRLLGVSCKASTCLVAADAVALNIVGVTGCPGPRTGAREVRRVSLVGSGSQVVQTATDIIVTPQISPTSGDVIAQVGGSPGHLQTFKLPAGGDLHLFHGLVP